MTRKISKELVILLLLTAVQLIVLLPILCISRGIGDEGFLLHGAERLATGQVLYRDFFTFLPPGSFLFLSLLFRIFGISLLTARVGTLVVSLVLLLCTYGIARRVLHRGWALLCAASVLFFGVPFWLMESHHWYSTAVATLAVFTFPVYAGKQREGGEGRLLLTGALTGLVFFLLQSKGFFLFSAFILYFFVVPGRRRSVIPFLVGAGSTALLFLIYLVIQGTLFSFFENAILWIFRNYSHLGGVGYFHDGFRIFREGISAALKVPSHIPHLLGSFVHLAIIGIFSPLGIFLSLVLLARRKSTGQEEAVRMRGLFLLLLTGGALFLSALSRPDISHLTFAFPLPIILFFHFLQAGLLGLGRQAGRKWKTACTGAIVVLFVISFSYACWDVGLFKEKAHISLPRGTLAVEGEGMETDYRILSDCIAEEIDPGDPIFAFPYLPLWYFLMGKKNPTSFLTAIEGHHTDEQLAELVEELEWASPPLVLYGALGKDPYGVSREEGLHHPLSFYIAKNYRIRYALYHYPIQILERKKK